MGSPCRGRESVERSMFISQQFRELARRRTNYFSCGHRTPETHCQNKKCFRGSDRVAARTGDWRGVCTFYIGWPTQRPQSRATQTTRDLLASHLSGKTDMNVAQVSLPNHFSSLYFLANHSSDSALLRLTQNHTPRWCPQRQKPRRSPRNSTANCANIPFNPPLILSIIYPTSCYLR